VLRPSAPAVLMAGPRWLLAAVWLGLARRRRRLGLYDRRTLALFWGARRLAPNWFGAWLALATFRRDLGRSLPRRWQAAWQANWPALSAPSRQQALDLFADLEPPAPTLAALRAGFSAWLAERRAQGGVCIAGNAAGLSGAGLGQRIDRHAGVLRFNQWRGAGTAVADTGCRIDVWVAAPGWRQPIPEPLAWAVVSGADPWRRMGAWPVVAALTARATPVLSVPLPIWRGLVRELQAPPSAGLLVLAWAHELGTGWQGLSIAGIGWGQARGRQHLVLSNRQTGVRHNWAGEARLIQRWREAGLEDLGRP